MRITSESLPSVVREIVDATPVLDVHTHLFPPDFGEICLTGIDQLLTYHYLVAETLRTGTLSYQEFWELPQREQANRIWQALFIDRTPISEACRGVITVLQQLQMDLTAKDLTKYRACNVNENVSAYVDRVFRLANVSAVVMTNDPFDKKERDLWYSRTADDSRFRAALRIDPLLNEYSTVHAQLAAWGYEVSADLSGTSLDGVRGFLREWIERTNAAYVAVSLPETFTYPDRSQRSVLVAEAVLPVCREHNIPLALMIGVKRAVNPRLFTAGDGVGKADVGAVERLCASFPGNKFMVTMLARENQHELAVAGRKFGNLMVFGCWWFLNNPSLIQEITELRCELLGTQFVPQHSDARILDQLVYKWKHSREVLCSVLVGKYDDLLAAGWPLSREEIERDVSGYLGRNFQEFLALELPQH